MSQKCGWVFVVLLACCATGVQGSAVCSTGTFASATYHQADTADSSWQAQHDYAIANGGRLLTKDEAIAHCSAVSYDIKEWIPVTRADGQQDYVGCRDWTTTTSRGKSHCDDYGGCPTWNADQTIAYSFVLYLKNTCTSCPAGSTTLAAGAESADACVCQAGRFKETKLFPPAGAYATCFGVDNNADSCEVAGQNYGNGMHALQYSSYYSTAYSPHTMFNSNDVSYGNDAAFASGQYNSNGIFVGSGQLNSDYPGDYIAISMPSKVRVTRIAMYMQTYEYQDYTVFAKKYQVLGRNSASDSWQKIHEEMDAMDSLFYDPIKCTQGLDAGTNCMHQKEITTDHSFSQIAVVFETKQPSEHLYVALAELNIYGTSAETCTSCPAGSTTLAPGADSIDACVCQTGKYSKPELTEAITISRAQTNCAATHTHVPQGHYTSGAPACYFEHSLHSEYSMVEVTFGISCEVGNPCGPVFLQLDDGSGVFADVAQTSSGGVTELVKKTFSYRAGSKIRIEERTSIIHPSVQFRYFFACGACPAGSTTLAAGAESAAACVCQAGGYSSSVTYDFVQGMGTHQPSLQTFTNYVASIGGSSNIDGTPGVHGTPDPAGTYSVFTTGNNVGYIRLPLPSNYQRFKISYRKPSGTTFDANEYGSLKLYMCSTTVNDADGDASCALLQQAGIGRMEYSDVYTPGQVLHLQEKPNTVTQVDIVIELSGCQSCSAGSTTLGAGAESANACLCQTGNYKRNDLIVSTDDHIMDKSDTAANDCATESKACRLAGPMTFPFDTSGVTMVMKIRMSGTKSDWERVFALGQTQPTAYTNGDINVFRHSGNQQLTLNVYLINSCHVNHAYTFAQNEDLTVWIRYNPSTQQMQMSVNSQVQTTSGCTMPSLLINQFVAGADHDYGYLSNMALAGFQAFGRYLTNAEIQAVADSIAFGADDGVVVLGCTSCPAGSTTLAAGAESSAACVCPVGGYETISRAHGGRPPTTAWDNSPVLQYPCCNNKAEWGVYDGVSTSGAVGSGVCIAFADNNVATNYVTLDLSKRTKVTAIETLGRDSDSQWITSYEIQVSDDNSHWVVVHCLDENANNYCVGNSDGSTIKNNQFKETVVARYVKLSPKTWNGYQSFRMSVIVEDCTNCPAGSTTLAVGAESADACVCQAGNYDIDYDSPELLNYYKLDGSVVDAKNPTDASKNLILGGTGGNAELDNSNPFFGTHSVKLTNNDGLQTYLEVPSFQVNEAFSLSLWFQWDLTSMHDNDWNKLFYFKESSSDFSIQFSRNNGASYGYFVLAKDSSNKIEYHHNTKFAFGNNIWRHLVLIINRQSAMQVYVDGSYVSRTNTAANKLEAGKFPLWTAPLTLDKNYIGRHEDSNKDNFDGYVDEIQIYDKALSRIEVEQIYELRGNPCESCPVGSTTLAAGAESADACVCQSGSFKRFAQGYDSCEAATPAGYTFGGYGNYDYIHGCYCNHKDVKSYSTSYGRQAGYCYYGYDDDPWHENIPPPGLDQGFPFIIRPRKNDGSYYDQTECEDDTKLPSGYTYQASSDYTIHGCYCYNKDQIVSSPYYPGKCYFGTSGGGGNNPPGPLEDGGNPYDAMFRPEECTSCPAGQTTLAAGAESADACVCQTGSFTNSEYISGIIEQFTFDNTVTGVFLGGTMTGTVAGYEWNAARSSHVLAKTQLVLDSSKIAATVDADEWTISMWVQFNDLSNDQIIIERRQKHNDPTKRGGFFIDYDFVDANTKKIRFYRLKTSSGSSYTSISSTIAGMATDKWYHVLAVCSRPDSTTYKMELFVNGVNKGSATNTVGWNPISYASDKIGIGEQCWTSSAANCGTLSNIDHKMDDLRFFDRALDSADISKLYNSAGALSCISCSPGQTTLSLGADSAAACVCESGAYENAVDVSTSASAQFQFDGALTDYIGRHTVQQVAGAEGYAADATYGDVLDLSQGSFKIVSKPLSDLLDGDSWSVSLWYKPTTSGATSYVLIRSESDPSTKGIDAYMYNNQFWLDRRASTAATVKSQTLTVNTWYHIVLLSTSTKIEMYVDNAPSTATSSDTASSTWYRVSNTEKSIGIGAICKDTNTPDCIDAARHGHLRDLRFYDYTLSATEISDIYNGLDTTRKGCTSCPPAAPYTDPAHGATSAGQCAAAPGSCGVVDVTIAPSPFPIRCSPNKFCVQYDEEANNIFCYGLSSGCLWNANDCSTDADCLKYDKSSPRYGDDPGHTCYHDIPDNYWHRGACDKYNPLPDLNRLYLRFSDSSTGYTWEDSLAWATSVGDRLPTASELRKFLTDTGGVTVVSDMWVAVYLDDGVSKDFLQVATQSAKYLVLSITEDGHNGGVFTDTPCSAASPCAYHGYKYAVHDIIARDVTSRMIQYLHFPLEVYLPNKFTLYFGAATTADVLVISGSHYRYVTNLPVSGAYTITVSPTGESSFLGPGSFGVTSGGGIGYLVPRWVLAENEQTCNQACGALNMQCNSAAQTAIDTETEIEDIMLQEFGITCSEIGARNYAGSPFFDEKGDKCRYYTDTWSSSSGNDQQYGSVCDHNVAIYYNSPDGGNYDFSIRPICRCVPATTGFENAITGTPVTYAAPQVVVQFHAIACPSASDPSCTAVTPTTNPTVSAVAVAGAGAGADAEEYLVFDAPATVTYDFGALSTPCSGTDPAAWTTYAINTVQATTNIDECGTSGTVGMWAAGVTVGYLNIPLPSTHSKVTIEYGHGHSSGVVLLCLCDKADVTCDDVACTEVGRPNVNTRATYTTAYTPGQALNLQEGHSTLDSDITITLFGAIYTLTFPAPGPTTGEALFVSGSTYTHVPALDLTAGTYTVTVAAGESKIVDASGVEVAGSAGGSDLFEDGVTNGLIAHWKFDENYQADATGNYPLHSDGTTVQSSAVSGWARRFVTDTDLIETIPPFQIKAGTDGLKDATAATGVTFSMWVKRTRTQAAADGDARDFLFSLGLASGNNKLMGATFIQGNKLEFFSLGEEGLTTTETFDDLSSWIYLTFTRSSTKERRIYANGVFLKGDVDSITLDTTGKLFIGRMNYQDGIDAVFDKASRNIFDDFRVYNRVLTDAEIMALHQMGTVSAITGTPTAYGNPQVILRYNAKTCSSSPDGCTPVADPSVQSDSLPQCGDRIGLVFQFHYHQTDGTDYPYTWQKSHDAAVAAGGRLPTTTEMKQWLKDNGGYGDPAALTDRWVATTDSNTAGGNYVQVISTNNWLNKTIVERFGSNANPPTTTWHGHTQGHTSHSYLDLYAVVYDCAENFVQNNVPAAKAQYITFSATLSPYSMTFPNATTGEALLVSGSTYTYVPALALSSGTYTITVLNPVTVGQDDATFDRTDANIVTLASPLTWNVDTNTGFTIITKFRIHTQADWQGIFNFGSGNGAMHLGYDEFRLNTYDSSRDSLQFIVSNGATLLLNLVSTDGTISLNQWHTVVIQYNSNSKAVTMDIDGTVSTGTMSAAMTDRVTTVNTIGKAFWNTLADGNYFDGNIAGFYAWDDFLSSTEVERFRAGIAISGTDNVVTAGESKIVDAAGAVVATSAGGLGSLTYDFTGKDTLSTWQTYATEIGGTSSFTSSLENPNIIWSDSEEVGYFELTLPPGYDSVTITYGSGGWQWGDWTAFEPSYPGQMYVKLCLCSSGGNQCTDAACVVKEEIYATQDTGISSTQTMSYTAGQVLRVEEKVLTIDMNMIIVLTKYPSIAITGTLMTYSTPQVILRYNTTVCPTTDTDGPSCPTDGTFVSGCPCPAETHFGSPGALVAFNPSSASEESFTRVALNSKNVGETSWPLQTSSGFTLITKFKFTGTGAWFENVAFFGKDGSIGIIWLRRFGSGSEELLDFRIYQGSSGISTDSKCTIQSAAGSAPQNTVLNIIARWDGSVIELDINGVKASADCSLVMQNRVLSETYIGSSFIDASIGGFVDSSRFLLGDMYGMYAWPRHLSDSEAAQVLAGIEIGGPDTLPTLQCCAADGTYTPECGCPANSYGPRKTITSYAEDNFKQGNADDVTSDTVLLSNGFTVELSGWTHTRDYANGYLDNSDNGEATATVVSLTPGKSYEYAIGVWNTVADYEGYFWVSVNGGTSVQLFQTQTLHNYAGTATAKSDGTIEFKFNNPDNLSMFSVASLRIGTLECSACPTDSTYVPACGCSANSYGPHGPLNGLVGMFGLNGNAEDEIGDASIQMYSGTATFVQDAHRGQVLDNGATQMYIESAVLSNALDQDAWSISFWFKASSWSTYLYIANRYDITTGANGQRGGFSFGLLNTGKLFLQRQREGANSWINCQGSTTITANTWYHVVAISEPRNLKVYLNGNVGTADCDVSSTTDWAHTQIDLPPKIGLGLYCVDNDSEANDCYVHSSATNDGYRQDLRFYNRVLTSDEIVELATRTGQEANVCASCPTDSTYVPVCGCPKDRFLNSDKTECSPCPSGKLAPKNSTSPDACKAPAARVRFSMSLGGSITASQITEAVKTVYVDRIAARLEIPASRIRIVSVQDARRRLLAVSLEVEIDAVDDDNTSALQASQDAVAEEIQGGSTASGLDATVQSTTSSVEDVTNAPSTCCFRTWPDA